MAGVYIKGMQMPLNCAGCRLMADGWCYAVGINGQPGHINTAKRPEWCPLIPVPDHGGLIDVSTVDLSDGPYEYADWVEWAFHQYLDAPLFLPADRKEGEA